MPTTPRPYWFPAKRYGWGWEIPATWQGWLAMALFVATIIAAAVLFAGRNWPLYFLSVLLTTTAFIAVCWWKGEPPRWRWGD